MKTLSLVVILLMVGGVSLCAWGAGVSLKWDPIQGSTKYQIEILDGNGKLETHDIAVDAKTATEWVGKLSFGYYRYRVRSWDRFDRPGMWSEPYEIKVAPPAPVAEKTEEKYVLTPQGLSIPLRWGASEGADRYSVRITDSSGKVTKHRVKKTEFVFEVKEPGKFSWAVVAQIAAFHLDKSQAPIQSEDSNAQEFEVAYPQLQAPQLISPLVKLDHGKQRVLVKWKPVKEAKAYEITFKPGKSAEHPVPQPERKFIAKKEQFGVVMPNADYVVGVRALASLGGEENFRGPESTESISEEQEEKPADQSKPFRLSIGTLVQSFSFQDESGSRNLSGNASGAIAGVVLDADVRLSPAWQLGLGGTYAAYSISNKSFSNNTLGLGAGFSLLGRQPESTLGIKINGGFRYRQMFDIAADPSSSPTTPNVTTTSFLESFVGTEAIWRVANHWDLGANLDYYFEIAGLSLPSQASFASSSGNIDMRVWGRYWMTRSTALVLGFILQRDAASYTLPGATASEYTKNFLTGANLSMVLSW